MDPQCTNACVNLVEKRKREIFGVGSCDHQVPYRPVVWDQIPHFVPQLLRQGVTPEMAKTQCMRLCAEKVPMLVDECKEQCIVEYNAVEPMTMPSVSSITSAETKQTKSKIYWIIVLISLLIVIIGSIFILKK